MNCPKCSHKTLVTGSHPVPRMNKNRRARTCTKCKYRFITFEILEEADKLPLNMRNLKTIATLIQDSIKQLEAQNVV